MGLNFTKRQIVWEHAAETTGLCVCSNNPLSQLTVFYFFLNRHCTESGIRNGPVISLIASTDKSRMGKIFLKAQLIPVLSAPPGAPGLLSHNGLPTPPCQPHTPGLARIQMADRVALQTRPISAQ